MTLASSNPFRLDAAAGLARVAIARCDMAAAREAIQRILSHLESGGVLDGG